MWPAKARQRARSALERLMPEPGIRRSDSTWRVPLPTCRLFRRRSTRGIAVLCRRDVQLADGSHGGRSADRRTDVGADRRLLAGGEFERSRAAGRRRTHRGRSATDWSAGSARHWAGGPNGTSAPTIAVDRHAPRFEHFYEAALRLQGSDPARPRAAFAILSVPAIGRRGFHPCPIEASILPTGSRLGHAAAV